MPHVFKLGKGPEHGHVNCSLLFDVPQKLILSSVYDVNYDTPKNVRFTPFNYPDLHLSVVGCMIVLTTTKRRNTHGT
jgi:hypothetical protein